MRVFHFAERPFNDGNRRTALVTALVFLEINGVTDNDYDRVDAAPGNALSGWVKWMGTCCAVLARCRFWIHGNMGGSIAGSLNNGEIMGENC